MSAPLKLSALSLRSCRSSPRASALRKEHATHDATISRVSFTPSKSRERRTAPLLDAGRDLARDLRHHGVDRALDVEVVAHARGFADARGRGCRCAQRPPAARRQAAVRAAVRRREGAAGAGSSRSVTDGGAGSAASRPRSTMRMIFCVNRRRRCLGGGELGAQELELRLHRFRRRVDRAGLVRRSDVSRKPCGARAAQPARRAWPGASRGPRRRRDAQACACDGAVAAVVACAGAAGSSTAGALVATNATDSTPATATPSAAAGERWSRARFLSSSCSMRTVICLRVSSAPGATTACSGMRISRTSFQSEVAYACGSPVFSTTASSDAISRSSAMRRPTNHTTGLNQNTRSIARCSKFVQSSLRRKWACSCRISDSIAARPSAVASSVGIEDDGPAEADRDRRLRLVRKPEVDLASRTDFGEPRQLVGERPVERARAALQTAHAHDARRKSDQADQRTECPNADDAERDAHAIPGASMPRMPAGRRCAGDPRTTARTAWSSPPLCRCCRRRRTSRSAKGSRRKKKRRRTPCAPARPLPPRPVRGLRVRSTCRRRPSGISAVAISAVVHSAWRVAAVSDRVLVATRTSAARTPPRRTLARIARSATPTIASTITAGLWPCRAARASGPARRRRPLRIRAGSARARAASRRRNATRRALRRFAALRRVRRPPYR